MTSPKRPLSILVMALGGEGGGVLCEWLVDAATRAGLPVSGTSIPGVAQRTGATTYYVEICRTSTAQLNGQVPVLSLTPVPGAVDLVISSELLETARALTLGFVDPGNTTLITSDRRALTNPEKMAMADGRFDAEKLLGAARSFSAELVSFDLQEAALSARTVVSAVMFGAVAASGKLPFGREYCESAIKASGKGVEASLAGFEAGFKAVLSARASPIPAKDSPSSVAVDTTGRGLAGLELPAPLEARLETFAAEAQEVLRTALVRLLEYQDENYARLFLERIDKIQRVATSLSVETPRQGELVRETARFLALWMMFDDVIRVADLKTRASRFARVRREVAAKPGEIVLVADYFKPRLEEVLGILPESLAKFLGRAARFPRFQKGWALALRSDSILGSLALVMLASLRRVRRFGSRFKAEQLRIDEWLMAIERISAHGFRATYELALCGRLIKGYGQTNARAHENLCRILDTLASATALARSGNVLDLADAIQGAREAALADPEGKALDRDIAQYGALPRPIIAKPIVFTKRLGT